MRRLSLAVVGADFANMSGPTRRFEIGMCKAGERIDLVLDPKNPADPNAIAVYSERGIQIGYVRAERAPFVGAAMRRGIVNAAFQRAESWGATIRVHLDGTEVELPPGTERPQKSAGPDWWPDEIWDDD